MIYLNNDLCAFDYIYLCSKNYSSFELKYEKDQFFFCRAIYFY
jgi:hypothetical protein